MTRLASVGEFALIEAIARLAAGRHPGVRVGIGDDAAAVAASGTTLLTTDTLVEDVHFRRRWLTPRALGRRAFRAAVSDVAAMGGTPRYALLSLELPARMAVADARALVHGFVREADASGTALVGGNVSSGGAISVTVTLTGQAPANPLLRSGAHPGDSIWVTGTLGGAAAGVELLDRGTRSGPLVATYRLPPLRVELARSIARSRTASSMIDVSDGLVQDLGHLCRASGVSARIDIAAVPLLRSLVRATFLGAKKRVLLRPAIAYALGGGEDYELLLTTRGPRAEAKLKALCEKRACMVSRIGEMTQARARPVVRDTADRVLEERGYKHFRSRR